jgi:hypothetical protein
MAAKKTAKKGGKYRGGRYEGRFTMKVQASSTYGVSPFDVLEKLTLALCADFPGDPSTPSVVVSRLKTGESYVSLVRYRERFGDGKFVVLNARAPTLAEALRKLANDYLDRKSAKADLAQALGRALRGRSYLDFGPEDPGPGPWGS